MTPQELIEQGKTALGIEFGSTRIKGVLTDYDGNVLLTWKQPEIYEYDDWD